jgi:hypothetical protein
MLDLETFGTRPGCVIRSIGAVMFDPTTDQIGAEFYCNVDQASCEAAGLHIDPRTAEWWTKQSQAARDALLVNPLPLHDALMSFNTWWVTHGAVRIWSHGANFDQPILEAAYHANGGKPGSPWEFWNSRCTRTLFDVAEIDTKASGIRRTGTHHNALDDARFQALCVQAAMRRITIGPQRPVTISKNEGVFG